MSEENFKDKQEEFERLGSEEKKDVSISLFEFWISVNLLQ